MNCYDAKEKICMYVDDALDDSERQDISEHLASCASCMLLLDSLRRVDQVFKADYIVEPPPAYWQSLPRIITNQLPPRPKPASVFTDLIAAIQQGLALPRVRWTFVGVGAVAVALVFAIKGFSPKTSLTPMTPAPEIISSQAQTDGMKTPVSQFEEGQQSSSDAQLSQLEELPVSESTTASIERASGSDMIVGNVRTLPVRLQPLNPPTRDKMLYPTTSLNTDIFVEDDGEEIDPDDPEWRVFALTTDGNSRQTTYPTTGSEKIDDPQNSFSQTLWIVQQSTSLDEKRNIWLSYINRETDPTYRALGIYNMALTLAKIVEDSKNREDAMQAAAFFTEHDLLLKGQMGEDRYLLKMSIFESILKN
jgi:hypothetical protein